MNCLDSMIAKKTSLPAQTSVRRSSFRNRRCFTSLSTPASRIFLARDSRLVLTGAILLALLFPSGVRGQEFQLPTQGKGALDAEAWAGGAVAQHDGSTAFNTDVWTGGVRLGRILTVPHGPAWFRGTLEWNFGLGPVLFSRPQTAYGFELDPVIWRWNFLREKIAPYFEMAAGVVFTNLNVPPGDTSSFNIIPKAGFGWQIFTRPQRSLDVGLYGWHLSNFWIGARNPSANGLQLTMGYHWFLQSGRQIGSSGAHQSAAAGPQLPQTIGPDRNATDAAPGIPGTPGVFTIETAEVLPKGLLTVSAYGNKFSRAPGSVTVLSGGISLGVGVTKKITLLAQFEPYRHLHISEPSQLSLDQLAGCPHDVFKAPIYCGFVPGPVNPAKPPPPQSSWKGPAAAYVPGFPFATRSTSDYGPLGLGLKVNFWSERRGDPLSVSLRAEFLIPTETAAEELARRGAQSGTLNYSFTLGLSKTFQRGIVLANNVTYVITGNPKANGQILLTPGDQIIFGQGFIFPLWRRLQLLTEYTGVFYQEGHAFGKIGIDTQNTSWGPNLPVDGVWGVRWSLRDRMALDVGYRYMLNLHQVNDRSGFIFQFSNAFRLSKR